MDNASTQIGYNAFVGKCVRINKYILAMLNAFAMFIFVTNDFFYSGSFSGIAAYATSTIVILYVVYKSADNIPAVAELPVIILLDLFTYIGTHACELPSLVLDESAFIAALLSCVACTFLVGIVSTKYENTAWITGCIEGVAGLLFICNVSYLPYGIDKASLLLLFIIFDIVWTIILYLIVKTTPEKVSSTVWIGALLISVFIVGLTFQTNDSLGLLSIFAINLAQCFNNLLYGGAALACCAAIAVIPVRNITGAYFGSYLSVDIYALVIIEELIATAKIVMFSKMPYDQQFLIGIALLVVLIVGTLLCMNNDYSGKKYFGSRCKKYNISIPYLLAQYCVVVSIIFLFKNANWLTSNLGDKLLPNIVVTIFFVICFCVERRMRRHKHYGKAYWLLMLWGIISETSVCLSFKDLPDKLYSVLSIGLFAGIVTILVINRKQPGARIAPDKLNIAVCGSFAVVCLVAIGYSFICL